MAIAHEQEERLTVINTPPTAAQICLVRFTWERVSELRLQSDERTVSPSQAFSNEFYHALFTLDPEIKTAFSGIVQKARVLSGILSFITRSPTVHVRSSKFTTIREINANHRISITSNSKDLVEMAKAAAELEDQDLDAEEEDFASRLYALGAQHASFNNVQPHMFDLVGPALLAALKKRLGNEYVPEMGEAWLKAHAFVAHHMKKGLESQLAWDEHAVESSNQVNSNCSIQ